MFGIGPMELLLILVVALLVLGPKRMPELARMLGRGLGEFRRASNDLRQSLALDDLQNDLRSGLTGAGKIHKPGQKSDRPAQAGDDLAPGTSPNTTPNPESPHGPSPSENPNPPDAKGAHPGELPADADPYAHNEPQKDSGKTAKQADPEEVPAAVKHATPADSSLGNVPVGGATRADDSRPRKADDERG